MRYPCPVCKYGVFPEPPGSYAICPICNWEDDQIQFKDRFYEGGANKESMEQAKENWRKSDTAVCILTADEGGPEYILARLANDLNFPAYFGHNYDALDECLSADVSKACIIWNESEKAKESLGDDFSILKSTFEDAAKNNPGLKVTYN